MRFLRSMVLVALVLLLLGSVGAAGAAEITVKTPKGFIPVGETVVVPVTVTGADRLDACDICVTADASSVTIAANTTNPVDGATLTVNTVGNTARISFYHLTGVSGDLTLCYLDCTPTKSGLSAPVDLTVGCIAEKGSAGTPGDAVARKYSVVNGMIATDRDQPVVTTLTVAPATVSPLFVGAKQQFAAKVYDQYGSAMTVPVMWSSTNTTVGMIDASSGLFTAVGEGTTGITAKAGDRTSGAVTVTVKATPLLFGDANNDGTVNQADTLRVLREVVGLMEKPVIGTELFWKTDVHANGVIEVSDALYIAQHNVGLRDVWFEAIAGPE
jgi:hypothetical protein